MIATAFKIRWHGEKKSEKSDSGRDRCRKSGYLHAMVDHHYPSGLYVMLYASSAFYVLPGK